MTIAGAVQPRNSWAGPERLTVPPAIRFVAVSKSYPGVRERILLRRRLAWRRPAPACPVPALRDVSFDLAPGEGLAVVGPNGAGKTTLLRLAAGISNCDRGLVQTRGAVAVLMELGAGFHPDLTGKENALLGAALLGLGRRRAWAQLARIVEFAEADRWIDQPLRTYSTGMIMRLAFALAIEAEPAIVLIDEALAVGDRDFQRKCVQALRALKAAGTALVCVSHATGLLREMCEQALWLEGGEIRMAGSAAAVLDSYDAAGKPA